MENTCTVCTLLRIQVHVRTDAAYATDALRCSSAGGWSCSPSPERDVIGLLSPTRLAKKQENSHVVCVAIYMRIRQIRKLEIKLD